MLFPKATGGMDVFLPFVPLEISKALILFLINSIANLLLTWLEQNQALTVQGIPQRGEGAVVSKAIGTITGCRLHSKHRWDSWPFHSTDGESWWWSRPGAFRIDVLVASGMWSGEISSLRGSAAFCYCFFLLALIFPVGVPNDRLHVSDFPVTNWILVCTQIFL